MKTFTKKDFDNVFRYLRVSLPTEQDMALARDIERELRAIATPKNTMRVCDATLEDGVYRIPELGLKLKSVSLEHAFGAVDKIAVSASTLGASVDKKISYYTACNMLKATIMDAVSSVMIENILDELEGELSDSYPKYHFSMRFSCGYGDLPLELQPKIIAALDATKLLGIRVNSANLMSPMKSITSFIGLSANKIENIDKNICENCNLRGDCVTKCKGANHE